MSSVTQTVPVDIIREIFAYFSTGVNLLFPGNFPWYLGHICSDWRSVFLFMLPQFWSEIKYYIHNRSFNIHKADHSTNMVQYVLERNAGYPFDIHLICMSNDPNTLERASHTFDMLVEESPRWRDVDLVVNPSQIPTLCRVKGRLPLMRSLVLKIANGPPEVVEDFNNTFLEVPSLMHLTIALPNLGWKTNWSQLKSLRLKYPRLDSIPIILQRARNIEALIVRATEFEDSNDAEIVTLPNLKYLEVINDFSCMKYIRAPALDELRLNNMCDRSFRSRDTNDVVSLLLRSNCKIARLTFTRMGKPDLDILQCTPELTQLTLERIAPEELRETITRLTQSFLASSVPRSQCAECPARRLQILQLYGLDYYTFGVIFSALSNLISLAEERSENEEHGSSRGLRSVIIELPDKFIPPEAEPFKNLRGIQIQFRLRGARNPFK